jgi:hypothetical protein
MFYGVVLARRVRFLSLSRNRKGEEVNLMDAIAIIGALSGILPGLAAVGAVAFQFWREMRRDAKKRPRK